jgi:hypothetical protein
MASTIYHVAKEWDGGDLLSLARREPWSDDLAGSIAEKWGCDAWVYYSTEGEWVHCHASLDEAIDYLDEWCPGGVILAIDASDLDIRQGDEYPHPVVRHEIPAWCVSVLEGATDGTR